MAYTFDDDSFSDLHKDARGFRPNESLYTWLDTATDDEKQELWNILVDEMASNEKFREECEKSAVEEFELRVASVIASGAGNRETALRWIFDAEDDEYAKLDRDYFCYKYGLPYGYFKKAA